MLHRRGHCGAHAGIWPTLRIPAHPPAVWLRGADVMLFARGREGEASEWEGVERRQQALCGSCQAFKATKLSAMHYRNETESMSLQASNTINRCSFFFLLFGGNLRVRVFGCRRGGCGCASQQSPNRERSTRRLRSGVHAAAAPAGSRSQTAGPATRSARVSRYQPHVRGNTERVGVHETLLSSMF